MKLLNDSKSLFGGASTWQKTEWILGLLSLVSGCFAISVVPFIRKDFGERYLGWLNLFFGYTVVANFMFLGTLLMSLSGVFLRHRASVSSPKLMFFFWLAFIAMSLYRR